jgi:S1-C subfamily serine protease
MKGFPKVCFTPRVVLGAMLFAAVTTFGLQAYVSYRIYDAVEKEQERYKAEVAVQQRGLEERIALVERMAETQKDGVEDRLRDIIARQDRYDRSGGEGPIGSPFDITDVMPSVIELVCLDNDDEDTFYSGSGTVVADHGLIVTNRHLLTSIDGSLIAYCGVGFTDDIGEPPSIEYIAQTSAVHDTTDLAILRIVERLDGGEVPSTFPALDLQAAAATRRLSLGDEVFIAGYPGIGGETFTFTEGVVSGRLGAELVKTSALIDSGTSGGAAFDSTGTFIGVPTAAARGEIGGSLGYLIDAEVVDGFLAEYFGGGIDRLDEPKP